MLKSLRVRKNKSNATGKDEKDNKKDKKEASVRAKKDNSARAKKKKKDDQKSKVDRKKKNKKVVEEGDHFTNVPQFFDFPDGMTPTDTGHTPDQKKYYEEFMKSIVTAGVDGLLKEYADTVRPYVAPNVKREVFDQNAPKNRYKDVVCNDVTRVLIKDGHKDGDYIHANYVKGLHPLYILTQGPTQNTTTDFWRMIVQEKVEVICMLCEFVEYGRKKCEYYYPDIAGNKLTFGDYTIICTAIDTSDGHNHKSMLTVEGPNELKHSVQHFRMKTWPDKTVPKSPLSVLRLLHLLRMASNPVVVHCSAGIGRTGTFVAVECALQTLLHAKPLSLVDVCKNLRNCRLSCVQVEVQYLCLAEIIGECGKLLKYVEDQQLNEKFGTLRKAIATYVADHPPNDAVPPPAQGAPPSAEPASAQPSTTSATIGTKSLDIT